VRSLKGLGCENSADRALDFRLSISEVEKMTKLFLALVEWIKKTNRAMKRMRQRQRRRPPSTIFEPSELERLPRR